MPVICFSQSIENNKNGTPNVVFIYADDLGRGMLSHYGQKIISTPNIDRLFQEGTAFKYAYGCMYSAPARASLLTGYHDCRTDKWNVSKGGKLREANTYEKLDSVENEVNPLRVELPAGDLYLPQVFKQTGYVTGQVGKLDWGFTATRRQIREHGWDYYCGYLDHQRAHFFYPGFLYENDTILCIPENTHPTGGRGFEGESPENYRERWNMTGKVVYSQDLFLERMIRFIREHKDEPFFLYHSTQLPHGPVAIPAVHPEVKDNKELTEIEKEYASMVKMLDDHVGILLAELEKQGILENTLVVFSVDNGHETYYTNGNRSMKSPNRDMDGRKFDAWDYPYRSDRTGDRFDGNNGMSGKKWMNWEGGVRVPLVFRWPGKIDAGKVSEQVVANYDLLPTFADLLDVSLTVPKDGVSLLPILMEGKERLLSLRYVYISSDEGPAVVDSDGWKLRYNKKMKKFRLHYLPNDYREELILNEKYPDVLERLKTQLEKETNLN
ncbi:MAG: sulfatase-like hydrolase/transferase [Tannerella sp.]|nr:sulfatase-like hydrolase/transferase [Tannerella sp.]